jgi:hypothetical protein
VSQDRAIRSTQLASSGLAFLRPESPDQTTGDQATGPPEDGPRAHWPKSGLVRRIDAALTRLSRPIRHSNASFTGAFRVSRRRPF